MENNTNNPVFIKRSKGRQKIPMDRRRERVADRLVTFSKRRSGLYKKISELSIMCGLDFAVLIISPSGKLFTFASPNIEFIASKLLGNCNPHNKRVNEFLMEVTSRSNEDGLAHQLVEVMKLVDQEEERAKRLEKMAKERQVRSIIETPVSDLSDGDVRILEDWLKKVQIVVLDKMNQLNRR